MWGRGFLGGFPEWTKPNADFVVLLWSRGGCSGAWKEIARPMLLAPILSVCLCGLRLTRELGVMLLLCYAVYLVLIVSGATVMLQSARGSLQLLVNFPAVPSTAAAFP